VRKTVIVVFKKGGILRKEEKKDYEGASDRNIVGNQLFSVHKVNTEIGFISAIVNTLLWTHQVLLQLVISDKYII
jgi:hypothetical protein